MVMAYNPVVARSKLARGISSFVRFTEAALKKTALAQFEVARG